MAAPYHTTLYQNLFLLRVSICFSEALVIVERREGREILTWRPHSSSPNVSLAVESCAGRLQECLHEHGGGKVGQVWYDGDVPLFLVNFHTRMALRKLVAGKSELEKKLLTKLWSDWGSPDGVRCKVDTQLYLVCPNHTHKEDHKVIPVNNKNQESCMDTWVNSQVLEFGSLLRGFRVEVPRPADRRRETLRKWERIDEQPSWSKLVKALVAINERRVARNIAEKYGVPFPSELELETAQKSPTASPVVKTELDAELKTKTKRVKPSTEKDDSKVVKIDKELDKLQMKRRHNRERTASAREEAEVIIEDVERLEQEKQLLLEEIRKKVSELDCFNKLHAQHLSISQREKEVLQECIKVKENELQEAKAKLQKKEKKLEKCKEKIQRLKKRIEEGVRELGVCDGKITELEQDKARAVAELESERIKSVERMESLKGKLRKEHAEKLRERLAEREDQLQERLAEKDAHIKSHIKEISELQQQLKLAVEMNVQILLQYKQLAELQESRMEREREKITLESDLMVVKRKREKDIQTNKEAKEIIRREQQQFSEMDEPPPLPPRTYNIWTQSPVLPPSHTRKLHTSSTSQSMQQSTPQAARPVAVPHSISPSKQRKLTVQCHKKKTAPCEMTRGSATTDDQFTYFTPHYSNSVYSYKLSTEKWKELAPSPYRNSGLVIIDGELTAVAGLDRSRYTNKLFTLRQGRWVDHYPPMNIACSMTTVVSTSDRNYIVVIGGYVGCWTATVELFHVRSRRWYELTNLPQALSQPSATVCDSQLLVIGRDGGTGYSCSLQALLSSDQPITSQSISNILTWTPLPQLPVKYSTAATLCGQLVTIGGERGGSPVNTINQLVNGQWVKIGSMSSDRRLCLVVTPSPDKMMIVGGYEEDSVEECVVV